MTSQKLSGNNMEKILFVNNRSVAELFFNHYITHKFCKPDKDNTEFRIVKTMTSKTSMSDLLDDLCEKAKVYRWFYAPSECNNTIVSDVLLFLNERLHRQFRPIFMSLISAFRRGLITKIDLENYAVFIKNFYFTYGMICNGKSNAIQDIVYLYANKIENQFVSDLPIEFINKLKTYYPPFTQFESSFKLLGYSNTVKSYKTPSQKRDIQYILKNLEMYFQSNTNELSVENFSIEHIANDDGTESHCRIGNLLPLSTPINNHAGNNSLQQKISYYKKSNFIMVKNFISRYGQHEKLSDNDIDERSSQMAKIAYTKIWKLD